MPSQTDCQEFEGARNPHGYGQVHMSGKTVLAHRLAWALHNGADPARKVVMHTCDNPSCVNPEHLVLGSQAENMTDMAKKSRRAIIPDYVVVIIRAQLAAGIKQRAIAAFHGICPQHVSDIKLGKRRKHV